MPKGVICGGAVDGSNQLGEIVTCQAMTARPDGAGSAACGGAAANTRAAASTEPMSAGHQPIRSKFISASSPKQSEIEQAFLSTLAPAAGLEQNLAPWLKYSPTDALHRSPSGGSVSRIDVAWVHAAARPASANPGIM